MGYQFFLPMVLRWRTLRVEARLKQWTEPEKLAEKKIATPPDFPVQNDQRQFPRQQRAIMSVYQKHEFLEKHKHHNQGSLTHVK